MRGAIRCSIFFSRPPKSALSLSLYAKQVHFLKNTSSVRACKKKMHKMKKSLRQETVLRTAAPIRTTHLRMDSQAALRRVLGWLRHALGEPCYTRFIRFYPSFFGGIIRMKLRPVFVLFAFAVTSSITQCPANLRRHVRSASTICSACARCTIRKSLRTRKFIAYTVSSTSLKDDKNRTRIWMMPAAGGEAHPAHGRGCRSPIIRAGHPTGSFWRFFPRARTRMATTAKPRCTC